ncbi:MAG: hypothetical protein JJU31_03820 [Wenzhouxiangella sp.]|nr:hypothetical protein [Wenzhouxiangella sp.]TVR97519.1 MAG: hypothetical protein EA418_03105 [Wenzhouxiangellaceae bacterium]
MLSVYVRSLLVAIALGVVPLALADVSESATEAPVAQPSGMAHYMRQAAEAYESGDVSGWVRYTERLHALRPHNQDLMRHLVLGYAQLSQFTPAFNMMLQMQQQGLAENWDQFDELESMREHRLYEHLSNLMREAGRPFGRVDEVAVLEGVSMPEALAIDPATDRLFVGTVREGQILVTEDRQTWTVFADPTTHEDLKAVMSLAVDPARNQLIVATGVVTQFRRYRAEDVGRTAILRLDLESGELVSRHAVIPDRRARLLGALTVASDGTIFAADALTPTIFRLGVDEQHPQPFFGHGNLTSLRGLAISDDDTRLYVADYDLGIFVIDARDAAQAWKLAVPETLNETGIDGLYQWNNHLVVIQNGISPQRVMRLQLGDDGLGVINVAPVVAALEQFDTPTFGVMADSSLLFLSGSHWNHVDAGGRTIGGRLPAVSILSTDVDSPEVMIVGREMLEQIRRQSGRD